MNMRSRSIHIRLTAEQRFRRLAVFVGLPLAMLVIGFSLASALLSRQPAPQTSGELAAAPSGVQIHGAADGGLVAPSQAERSVGREQTPPVKAIVAGSSNAGTTARPPATSGKDPKQVHVGDRKVVTVQAQSEPAPIAREAREARTPPPSPPKADAPSARPADVEAVTLREAKVERLERNAVVMRGGGVIRVGQAFPSGEKLMAVSPERKMITTDQRTILLLP